MTDHVSHAATALIAALLLSACTASPGAGLSFQDMQARQAAVQAVLTSGKTGDSRPWQGPDGAAGRATLTDTPDGEGCRQVETTDPGGATKDTWCPTPHGFWVHPDELFYRNATGRETYGGAVRSRAAEAGTPGAFDTDDRPDQIDCLRLLRDEQRLADGGRDNAARAKRRAFHKCLQQSR